MKKAMFVFLMTSAIGEGTVTACDFMNDITPPVRKLTEIVSEYATKAQNTSGRAQESSSPPPAKEIPVLNTEEEHLSAFLTLTP